MREWLRELGTEDRNVIGQDLMRIQYRWPVGMPLCRPLALAAKRMKEIKK